MGSAGFWKKKKNINLGQRNEADSALKVGIVGILRQKSFGGRRLLLINIPNEGSREPSAGEGLWRGKPNTYRVCLVGC